MALRAAMDIAILRAGSNPPFCAKPEVLENKGLPVFSYCLNGFSRSRKDIDVQFKNKNTDVKSKNCTRICTRKSAPISEGGFVL